jgi:serine protease Do
MGVLSASLDLINSKPKFEGGDRSSVLNGQQGAAPFLRIDDVFRDGKIEKLALKVGELDGKSVASGKASAGDVKKLGMTLQTLTPELARDLSLHEGTRGVLIMEVEPDGLAAFAGLQPRQVVTSVNGNPVADVEQFGREVMKRDLKDGLRLHVKSAQGSRFVYLKDAGKK